MSPASRVPSPAPGGGAGKGRRTYTTGEVRLIRQLYPHHTAAYVAARLGRTTGSLYSFLTRHPELRKQGRP